MCECADHTTLCECSDYFQYRAKFPEHIDWFVLYFKNKEYNLNRYIAYSSPRIDTESFDLDKEFLFEAEGQIYFIQGVLSFEGYQFFRLDREVVIKENLLIGRRLEQEEYAGVYNVLSDV